MYDQIRQWLQSLLLFKLAQINMHSYFNGSWHCFDIKCIIQSYENEKLYETFFKHKNKHQTVLNFHSTHLYRNPPQYVSGTHISDAAILWTLDHLLFRHCHSLYSCCLGVVVEAGIHWHANFSCILPLLSQVSTVAFKSTLSSRESFPTTSSSSTCPAVCWLSSLGSASGWTLTQFLPELHLESPLF